MAAAGAAARRRQCGRRNEPAAASSYARFLDIFRDFAANFAASASIGTPPRAGNRNASPGPHRRLLVRSLETPRAARQGVTAGWTFES
jgi:hypothetical protein